MRIAAMVAMAVLAGTGACARNAGPTAGQIVPVCLMDNANVPASVLIRAKGWAGKMFEGAGVYIEWRNRPTPSSCTGDAVIWVNLVEHTPPDYHRHALAAAKVFEGVHITVFYDRVEHAVHAVSSSLVPTLLAHVLVHEITHILQGVDQHSKNGVMKARWTVDDYGAMRCKPLPFAAEDLELIRIGLAFRQARMAKVHAKVLDAAE